MDSYPETLVCQLCGDELIVSSPHPWSEAEQEASYLLGHGCRTGRDFTPHRRKRVHGEKSHAMPIERDLVTLAPVSVQCHSGHLSRSTSLQEAVLTYEGNCAECGKATTLSATLKRRS